jgi:hypothetical protein
MGYLDTRLDVLPMTYTIADAYVRNLFNTMASRGERLQSLYLCGVVQCCVMCYK